MIECSILSYKGLSLALQMKCSSNLSGAKHFSSWETVDTAPGYPKFELIWIKPQPPKVKLIKYAHALLTSKHPSQDVGTGFNASWASLNL